MTQTFKSKIGIELIAPLVIVQTTVVILLMSGSANSWIALIIPILTTVFIVHMFLTTNYKIEGNILKVKCGFLFNKEINLNSITQNKRDKQSRKRTCNFNR